MSSVSVNLTISSKNKITPREVAESVAYLFKYGQFGYERPKGIMAVSPATVSEDGKFSEDGKSAWVPLDSLATGGE
jgi:hypothetical protein